MTKNDSIDNDDPAACDLAQKLVVGAPRPLASQDPLLKDLQEWAGSLPALAGLEAARLLPRFLIHSRHLQALARQHEDALASILSGDGEQIMRAAITELDQTSTDETANDEIMMAAIRRLRQRSALTVALSDIACIAGMTDQMRWLSDAADAALNASVRFLFLQAERRGLLSGFARTPETPAPHADMPPISDMNRCGWVILALGKLGARELNYSSDVDLIVLHDPVANPLVEPETSQRFYVEMTRALVRLLSAVTRDGIGWRVDLRLRPDPGATAVSIQKDAAIGYYESIARTWERAAFIRARPVAGDLALGAQFLADIQPFIWRRNLDYTVLDDMQTMLQRPAFVPGWTGFNLKTGPNGIRSIEFFTHVLQLVGGGRLAALRQPSTLPALDALAEADWITQRQRETLSTLYHALRQVEHRLQMLADAQTHSLPRSESDIDEFAQFLGHENKDEFLAALGTTLDVVGAHCTHRLFDGMNRAAMTDAPPLENEEMFQEWLASKGFKRPADISAILSGWMAGRIATTRGERARSLLTRMMPNILVQLASAVSPDECFAAFAGFVEGLPASVQIFSLLDHNRDLGRLLGDILVLSPRLARQLRRHPILFDLVLFDDFFAALPDATGFEEMLRADIKDQPTELALDTITRLTRERRFRAEVQTLSGVADTGGLGRALSDTADAVIRVITDLARSDMERRHGRIEGDFFVLGLGRLGVGDLTATSDLDLIFVWDASGGVKSDGTRQLEASTYFTRLAQTLVNWLGGATGEGSLFTIDARLRPDGEKANLAVSLSRMAEYYQNEAWLWEKLALGKGRLINDINNAPKIIRVVEDALASPVPLADVSAALADMLARLRSSYGPAQDWQLRHLPGGIGELDLLIQGMRMINADLFTKTGFSGEAILQTLADNGRIGDEDAAMLLEIQTLFAQLQHNLRLVNGGVGGDLDLLATQAVQFVLHACDSPDQETLNARLKAMRGHVEALFERQFPV